MDNEMYVFMRHIDDISKGKSVSARWTVTLGTDYFYYYITKEDGKTRIDLTPVNEFLANNPQV